MDAAELLTLAMSNLYIVAPALLLFVGLMVANAMTDFVVRLIKSAEKHFRT